MIGIYKITNKINNHAYIGQSVDINGRINRHKRDSKNINSEVYNYPLYKAFRKYGIENFSFEILEECKKEELNEREIYWISFYDTVKNGYNVSRGGQSPCSFNQDKINEVKDLLENTRKTFNEISEITGIKYDVIVKINKGKHWIDEDRTYPIRYVRPTKELLEKILQETNFNLIETAEYFNLAVSTLQNWIRKFEIKLPQPKIKLNLIKYDKQKKLSSNKKQESKENFCPICGKLISRSATYCSKCRQLKLSKKPLKKVLEQQLIDYKGNLTQIAKLYNLTDNAIKKWCKSYNLDHTTYRFSLSKEEIEKALEETHTLKKTAEILKVSETTIKKYCNKYDINYQKYLYQKPSKEKVIELLKFTKHDIDEVANLLNCSIYSVKRYIEQYDIDLRNL